MEMFTRSLSTPLRIWWKLCKRFTFTTLSRVHFSNSLYGWWGLYDIYNHLQQRDFRVLKYRKYASIPWKKWLWFVIRLSHGISRHCSEQKIHVLRAIKIISIILSLRIVIRSALKAGFTMKFYYTGRDYQKATNDNFTSFIQINV